MIVARAGPIDRVVAHPNRVLAELPCTSACGLTETSARSYSMDTLRAPMSAFEMFAHMIIHLDVVSTHLDGRRDSFVSVEDWKH